MSASGIAPLRHCCIDSGSLSILAQGLLGTHLLVVLLLWYFAAPPAQGSLILRVTMYIVRSKDDNRMLLVHLLGSFHLVAATLQGRAQNPSRSACSSSRCMLQPVCKILSHSSCTVSLGSAKPVDLICAEACSVHQAHVHRAKSICSSCVQRLT